MGASGLGHPLRMARVRRSHQALVGALASLHFAAEIGGRSPQGEFRVARNSIDLPKRELDRPGRGRVAAVGWTRISQFAMRLRGTVAALQQGQAGRYPALSSLLSPS